MEKYEKWLEEKFDPNEVLEESRPYSATSGRYTTWDNTILADDPFGFYSERLTAQKHVDEGFPYYLDYPMNDNRWGVGEVFDYDFDDTDYAREQAELLIKEQQVQKLSAAYDKSKVDAKEEHEVKPEAHAKKEEHH